MISILILADAVGQKAIDLGDRALRSNKTGYAFCMLAGVAGGFALGVECVRAAF